MSSFQQKRSATPPPKAGSCEEKEKMKNRHHGTQESKTVHYTKIWNPMASEFGLFCLT
jgi:glucose dehydrogenase